MKLQHFTDCLCHIVSSRFSTALIFFFSCPFLSASLAPFQTAHWKPHYCCCYSLWLLVNCAALSGSLPMSSRDLLPLPSPLSSFTSVKYPGRAPTLNLTPISMVTEADLERSRQPWPQAAQLKINKLCTIILAAALDSM